MSHASQDEGQRHWLENILPLLTEAREMFASDEEGNKVYEVVTSLQKMDQARSQELDTHREKLRALSRQAEGYKHSAQRPANALTEKQHESKLVELDAKRYGMAKTVADLEQAIASADITVSRSKEDVARREREDALAGHKEGVSDVLKLQIYRGLGFISVPDKTTSGSKLLIRGISNWITLIVYTRRASRVRNDGKSMEVGFFAVNLGKIRHCCC